MEKHIFFTGPRGSGKSTVLQKYVKESGLYVSGIVTLKVKDESNAGYSVHMLKAGQDGKALDSEMASKENFLFSCEKKEATIEIGERFDEIGFKLLNQMPQKTQLIVLDEIGPMEQHAKQFQKAVLDLLDGDIKVIGVLQQEESDFSKKIKSHPHVKVLEVRQR